jgi:penicillin-binding protein 1B
MAGKSPQKIRIIRRVKQKKSLFRRALPFLAAISMIVLLVGGAVLIHYYFVFSQLIDAGLRGDTFVRASGIYAAPMIVRTGSSTSAADLTAHLKRIGYLEKGTTKNDKRGQYQIRGSSIEIYPGADTTVDGEKQFRNLRVSFTQGVQSITDLSTRESLDRVEIEPELISSVVTQDREKRKIVDYNDLPKNLVNAIVTIEDRQFFDHYGLNIRGIIRALIRNYEEGMIREGGSSITSQVVKNLYLTQEKTFKRKLAEAYISVLLETRLSKEKIMEMYCNLAYQGQRSGFTVNGMGESARSYFDKDVSQLTLAECALLAGIIRNPNYYSPVKHADRAKDRRNLVIEKMYEEREFTGVTRDEADKAKASPLGIKARSGGLDVADAPYFVDYLTRYVENRYEDDASSLKSLRIYSTLDLSLQRAAYQAVSKHMGAVEKALARRKGGTAGLQAALVAMNPKTGEVLAMIGGRGYADSQFNRATEAKRQPGSVFKPFVYATALMTAYDFGNIITPATMFMDEPKIFTHGFGDEYKPGNFGDSYERKPITLRDALTKSKNVITVEVAEQVGFSQVARTAEKAGLPRPPTYPSMALGVMEATPLQMASAYTAFANNGRAITPVIFRRVINSAGQTVMSSNPETREVFKPAVAYMMTSMMKDVLDRGTGTRVRQMGFTAPAAGKTGTSRDGWFVGYTSNLVCAVYVGFDDGSDLGLTGGNSAAPIWAEFMMKALQLRPEYGGEFAEPDDLTTVDIDPSTGQVARAGSLNVRHELFIRGTEPGNSEAVPDEENPDNREPSTDPASDPPEAGRVTRDKTEQSSNNRRMMVSLWRH